MAYWRKRVAPYNHSGMGKYNQVEKAIEKQIVSRETLPLPP